MEGQLAKSKLEAALINYIKAHYMEALKKLEASRPIECDLIRLKEELINELNLIDLRWDCDWGVSHIRGCLKNLGVLAKQYPQDMAKLKGKRVIFSRSSGIGLDGQIVLNIEDVRNSWLDQIRSIQDFDPFVAAVPLAEKELSGKLREILINQ